MAKSAGFFTLRRGSTKSLTFQVLDGKQITKDRVSVVKNPKTSRQADQRAKLLPAQRFMTMLRSIVDHSWENVAYGQKSLQHFMSKAMRIRPENPMVKGEIGWFPQSYPISEGSLPSMRATIEGGQNVSMTTPGLNVGVTTYAELIASGRFIEGDQITVIGVIGEPGEFRVKIDRLIVNPENVTFSNSALKGTTQNGLFVVDFSNGAAVDAADDDLIAGAVILSRRTASKWLRSPETMAAYNVNNVLWSTAVASYMAATSEMTSPWYLNAADNDVFSPSDVEDGEWSPVMLGPSQNWGSDTTIYLGAKNNLYGNYAVITSDGTSGGFSFTFAGLSSGKTIKDVVLSDFTQSQTRGNAVMPEAVARYGTFGSETLSALAEGQPDQFAAASAVGK